MDAAIPSEDIHLFGFIFIRLNRNIKVFKQCMCDMTLLTYKKHNKYVICIVLHQLSMIAYKKHSLPLLLFSLMRYHYTCKFDILIH